MTPKSATPKTYTIFFQQPLQKLDFFVILSSLAGLLGNASQSNYAAGNTFQDALARHRSSLGLSALTIDVGKVVDAGWMSQNVDLVHRGVLEMAREIRVKDLTAIIEHHMRANTTAPGKAAAQVAVGIESGPTFNARFSHIDASLMATSQKQESQDQTRSLDSQIAAARHDGAKVSALILEAFKRKLDRLLALKFENVHGDDTIMKRGVDSLVAVEIRNWLRNEVGLM